LATVYSFEELQCWKLATELRRDVSVLLKTFPASEKFELISQTRRASRSVTNNIAEGFGRYHYKEFIRFCRISRASLMELLDHLLIALDEGYIDQDQMLIFRTKIDACKGKLNGFIAYLVSRTTKSGSKVEEPIEFYGLGNPAIAVDDTTNNY
jgi:four helix bundle protein